MSKPYQGGFSDEVANSYRFTDYVDGYRMLSEETCHKHRPGGYIGERDRTPSVTRCWKATCSGRASARTGSPTGCHPPMGAT